MHEHSSSRRRRTSVGTGTLALSLGLCLCAGQLVATPAASAAVPVVQAASASAKKVKPTVRTTLSSKRIAYGKSFRLTVHYFNPSNGKSVTSGLVRLQAKRHGKWITWSKKSLGKTGTVSFTAAPKMSRYFRTYYTGNGNFTAHSGPVKLVRVNQPASKSAGGRILAEARRHTGSLYKFGASGPSRFDCSGFTRYVYKKTVGKQLPHKANSQQKYGKAVAKSRKRIGDLIVFRNGSYGYHAGIYAGGGYIYDSPHTGARVGKHKMFSSNYVVRRLAA